MKPIPEGYTEQFHASGDFGNDLFIAIRPNEDFDTRFKAWDIEMEHYININGWLFSFERAEHESV